MRKVIGLVTVLALALIATPVWAGGQSDLREARQGTAKLHKVTHAEDSGYGSTLDVLGCFESPAGGMGVHYLNGSLLDDVVDAGEPEALVYEMRGDGSLKLVGLEYLVPVELVDEANPPSLFGHQFHPHPTLPFWIMHAWIWRPNPNGMFMDWNPAVRSCPDNVPIFGVDLP